MRRRRGIMGLNGGAGIPVITATATGNPLTFETDLARPLESLAIPFTPIQAGSGDPSPTNIRPISGWTGTTIYDGGVNILPPIDNGYYPLFLPKGTTLTASIAYTSATLKRVNYYRKDKTLINYFAVNSSYDGGTRFNKSFTLEEDAYYFAFSTGLTDVQLEIGSSASSYTSPQSNVIPITFTDPTTGDPMTIYGGTVTLNEDGSADLVEDWYHFTWDGVTNKATRIYGGSDESQQYVNFYSYISILEKNIVGSRWVQNTVICDTLSEGSTGNPEAYRGSVAINFCYIYIRKDVLSEVTVAGVNAYLQEHPVTFSGKALDGYFTPNVYHFDNIGQLITFVGTNNIWTDTNGTNTATYFKHQS